MSEFLAMGGYAAYVWPAYGLTLAGIAGAVLLTWRGWRAAKASLDALEKDQM
jgi:heme exporter protein D